MFRRQLLTTVCVATVVAACGDDPTRPPDPPVRAEASWTESSDPPADGVTDLRLLRATRHAATLAWTQVGDGTGRPAAYRLKFARSPLTDWKTAEIGCDVGAELGAIGADVSCELHALEPLTAYDFQLMSYRLKDGRWAGAVYSNVASDTTEALDAPGPIDDLAVVDTSAAELTVSWTQVNDGSGQPATYRVRHAEGSGAWQESSVVCDRAPEEARIGAPVSCTLEGLEPETSYDVQVSSFPATGVSALADAALSNVASVTTAVRPRVRDLALVGKTPASLTVRWTQIDDGAGRPARYRVKYAASPMDDWSSAEIGCDRTSEGDGVGAPMSCTVEGLEPGTTYDVRLMSYHTVNGAWEGAEYSNTVTGRTPSAEPRGIWVSPERLASAPRSGPVWDQLAQLAGVPCGGVDLSDPERYTHLCVMTQALLYAATGEARRLDEVVAYLTEFSGDTYTGSAWVLGREVPAYVIAADLVGLAALDPELDAAFRAQLTRLRTTPTDSGPPDLVACHEERPNNWGTHCGAARAAIAAYLGDTAELQRVAAVFEGWLGNRAAYAGFDFGGPENDLSWQCAPAAPAGVNPAGCSREGHDIGGVLPDDQRRSGSFSWPPPRENYVWEALQGALALAVILHNAGYAAFEWEDRALLRAVAWLYDEAGYPAEGDDQWVPHVVNHFYGTSFAAPTPANPGKIVAWAEWTHG